MLTLLLTPILTAAAVLVGASPASAAPEYVRVSYGFGYVEDVDGFYGALRDTTTPDGYCVEMQRKTSAGDWVTSGFWSDSGGPFATEIHVVACTTAFVYWHIRNSANIHGLRLHRYPTGPATDFCSDHFECQMLSWG
jgi:hypothetical protein